MIEFSLHMEMKSQEEIDKQLAELNAQAINRL